jgi:hypothetical protein
MPSDAVNPYPGYFKNKLGVWQKIDPRSATPEEREKVIDDFLSHKDNHAKSVAARTGMDANKVNRIITKYLDDKMKKL